MSISKDYLHFPASTTIEEVLRTYNDRKGQWWWLLITEIEGEYYVCSFGSLLPYLAGRTPHIVHNIGDCPICSGIDPLLWRDTEALVEEVLADTATLSRLISDLPMAELPIIEAENREGFQFETWLSSQAYRTSGVTKDGVLCGVFVLQVKGDLDGMPDF